MPQGGGTRLGGEFQVGDVSVRGRRLFFEAFARLHPEAVSDLQTLAQTGTDDQVDAFCEEYNLWCVPRKAWLAPDEQTAPDWLRLGVRDTVRIWRASAWAREQSKWVIRRLPTPSGDEAAVADSSGELQTDLLYRLSQSLTWDPTEKTEAEFRDDVEKYIKCCKQECAERDDVYLAPVMRDLLTPYEWTVRFYIDGHSYSQLAVSSSKDVDSVRKTVRKISDQIGLPRPRTGRRYPPT